MNQFEHSVETVADWTSSSTDNNFDTVRSTVFGLPKALAAAQEPLEPFDQRNIGDIDRTVV